MSTLRANVIAQFIRTSPADVLHGVEWYARAHRLAVELDPGNVSRAAGIIAALSPVTSWPQNVAKARAMYAGEPVRGLGKNVAKAYAIYNGANPLDVLGGDKVRAFYMTILDPSISDAVVVDRHAIDIAAGKVQSDADRSAMVKVTKASNGYNIIAQAYREAARIISAEFDLSISPAQLQAIVWVSWRNDVIKANHGDA